MAVKNEFDKMNLSITAMQLGEVEIATELDTAQLVLLSTNLKILGFELLNTKDNKIVDRIKNLIIDQVHYKKVPLKSNLSTYLANDLMQDYSSLSKLFSEKEGVTIEHYFIAQKIEKVKELLLYNELSLSEIAYELHYSTVGHLSNQFKKTTGITPTQFKRSNEVKRKQIDEV
jgi:AraC-like DNA-binding protein